MKCSIKMLFVFSICLTAFILSGCSVGITEKSQIKIIAGNQDIQVISYENISGQTMKDLEEVHKKVINDIGWEELTYVSLNETIFIETSYSDMNEIEVYDYILARTGEFKYAEDVAKVSTIPVNNGESLITLQRNNAINFSSDSEDYSQGNTLRCFIVQTNKENSTPLFAFIVRTDAR
ncbi:hypothetical protein [Sutcliffiella halmapala]|uniref:hypothetical protein n=1 Tax=Sutcliffiella halmapala TaxID=79882 RepID=UPI000995A188|nr:hypothetical protein [Sutcliffiella halmapala]